ncbi:MAG: 30S ribosomal protein S8 [Candidatus Methanofastidiosum methylothiophilum]|jgi:small subunit ribosomal protein S8|uniref:Small ribosomal subunit protein uS8 n=1 Tax=Candidatus Methanofastidiosum methylothiophilum TaxID=1705564 RepID=A0A150JMN6_9EURY|nr:MAG: 30S ribosomal protein S8 [Candidatus Methanofastidiosum methylthiophilus]MBP6932766.1 30S ribosomal protein S8 [Methanofastidiosum sp.]NMA30436.1 30S ribosomal protein S8 [Candidatus Methanofastidiosa archaeon]OQC52087.1 MAG: 30S ribosomal protein S8 [Euryarchaeota archaeon ADurb.Bin023]KYC56653.1 MAG: 30S ribosomal protein S8 [Candidatus Methanofastidiosum methylthiophilus]
MKLDPLADALSNIYNYENARKPECIIPASKLMGNILRIMQKWGYIGAFEFIDDGKNGLFKLELLGAINKCGVIKPTTPVKKYEIEDWEMRYLPAKEFGILIMTTPNGVMSHKKAKEQNIGGILLAYVY